MTLTKKMTKNSNCFKLNIITFLDGEPVNKKYIDDQLSKDTVVKSLKMLISLIKGQPTMIVLLYAGKQQQQIKKLPLKNIGDELDNITIVRNNKNNDFNKNKLTNTNSVLINRNRTANYEVTNKKNVADSIGDGTIVGFKGTLEKQLKVGGGGFFHNPGKRQNDLETHKGLQPQLRADIF